MSNFDGKTSKLHMIKQALLGEAAPKPKPATPSTRPSLHPSRTWDPEEWEEDKRFVDAMDLVNLGRKAEALMRLVDLVKEDPEHPEGRYRLLLLALELDNHELIRDHADRVLARFHRTDHAKVCEVYRAVRDALPNHAWSEKALVHALLSGDKTHDARVVVDATKLLLHLHPQSSVLPRALWSTAEVQLTEGRPDLAKTTLQNLIARFPLDSLAQHAHRKLGEL